MLDKIKARLEDMYADPAHGSHHNTLVEVLKDLTAVVKQHQDILIYEHKTLDLEYHRRADAIHNEYLIKVDEDEELMLPAEERLARVRRFGREARQLRKELDKEFDIGEAS